MNQAKHLSCRFVFLCHRKKGLISSADDILKEFARRVVISIQKTGLNIACRR